MRASTVGLIVALALLAPACGTQGSELPPAVDVKVGSPKDLDTVREDRVEISGTVTPAGARVRVLGKLASVSGGQFRSYVKLRSGINLIDISASAKGRRPDFAAVRVAYQRGVTMPDLIGADPDAARQQLTDLGLAVEVDDIGGFLDTLADEEQVVCEVDQDIGTVVEPGTTITLGVARGC